jgi:serine/threonine protein kinase
MVSSNQFESSQPPLGVGSIIDGYVLTSLLGKGGMGAVYCGRRGGMEYALKVMVNPTELAAARFEREALILSRVSQHPNIVTVHNYSKIGHFPYMVSDKIDGISLGQWLDGYEIEFERVLEIGAKVADALAHIHKHGILHRDLKPDNVLIRHEDGQVFLTDFGLGKDADSEDSLTKTGDFLGTPHYMSPEQIEGDRDRLGPTADIWSLGVLLYQLATGQLPFDAPSSIELIPTIMFQEPTKISVIAPSLPRAFSKIILAALQKAPEDRYQSASQLANDCRALKKGQAVIGSRPSFGSRVRRYFSGLSPRSIMKTLLILSLIIVGGLAISFIIQRQNAKNINEELRDEIAILSKSKHLSVNKIDAITVRLIEEFVHQEKDEIKLDLGVDEFVQQWLKLENRLRKQQGHSVLKDKKVRIRYKKMKEQLSHLPFLISLFENTKLDLNGQSAPRSWRQFFRGCRALREDRGAAYKSFERLASESSFEAQCALLALIYCDIKSKHWTQAEYSLVRLVSRSRGVVLKKAKQMEAMIFQNALAETLIKWPKKKPIIFAQLNKLTKLAGGDDRRIVQLLKPVQDRLGQYFKEAPAANDQQQRVRSYSILAQLCHLYPLSRPVGHFKLHLIMVKEAEKSNKEASAIFHYYQALNANLTIDLPTKYKRYPMQDTIRLNAQMIGRGSDESLIKLYQTLLEISHSGWYFKEILSDEELAELEQRHELLSRSILANPLSPYPRFWRLMAFEKLQLEWSPERQLRRFNMLKKDMDYLQKLPAFSRQLMAAAQLQFVGAARLTWLKMKESGNLVPFKSSKFFAWLDKSAAIYPAIEADRLLGETRSVLLDVFLRHKEPLNERSEAEKMDMLYDCLQREKHSLDERYKWSQQSLVTPVKDSNRRLRLSGVDHHFRKYYCYLQISKIYRLRNDRTAALKELALAKPLCKGFLGRTLNLTGEYIDLKEYGEAQRALDTLKNMVLTKKDLFKINKVRFEINKAKKP